MGTEEEGNVILADMATVDFGFGFPETDITLIVEGNKFHVNRAVLSHHSPVFNAMLNGHFKESSEKEIVLEDCKAEHFKEFLKSLYPNMKHSINGQNVLQVLPLAHKYQSPLVTDCEDFMETLCQPGTGITVSTLLDYILAAEKFNLGQFLKTAVKFCARVDFDLLKGKKFSRKKSLYSDAQYTKSIDNDVHKKFLQLSIETQYSIAKQRLKFLEMYKKKKDNSDNVESDFVIPLS